jgi:hypothetical protein
MLPKTAARAQTEMAIAANLLVRNLEEMVPIRATNQLTNDNRIAVAEVGE